MKNGCLISILLWAAIFAIFVLATGCAEVSAFRHGVAAHGADAADQALETSRWGNCEAATVGAVKRRYARDPEGLRVWQQFCSWPVTQ